jgi:hypothetical protein
MLETPLGLDLLVHLLTILTTLDGLPNSIAIPLDRIANRCGSLKLHLLGCRHHLLL